MIKSAARQGRYKLNNIFSVKGMDHIQSFGSAMNDAWNMLYSKRKPKCARIKEDSQTIFLMQVTSRKILWVCVWLSVCISQYEALDMRNSVFLHTLSEEAYGARLLDFSSVQYMDRFRSKIPSLSQQDTSIKASDIRNWIFLNKQPKEKLLRYGTQSSIARHCGKSFERKISSLLQQATRMASHIRHPTCVSTTLRTVDMYDTVSSQYMTVQLKDQVHNNFVRSTIQSRHMPTWRIECSVAYPSYIYGEHASPVILVTHTRYGND